jgi:serine/threonine protein kinase
MHGASAALRGQKWYFSPVEEGELSTGRVILGRFRLERELGHGGMGTVWAATHTLTGKSLALKFLKASSAGDETARRRFFREARSACAVRHPHVVSVHDVIELDDGAPVMVMDLLEGESLRARLDRENTISLELLRPIVIQVLSALEALHAQGIVHRDLKPDNVFLCSAAGEGVKLLDFGIAKHVARDEASTEGATDTGALTGTGAMLGTPFYMAPEQAFGEKDIDARVDLWAIGIVLYECLAGVRPTQGGNLGQILKMITFAPLPSIALRVPELPEPIVRIIDRCLSREKADRPRDVMEVRAAFEGQVPLPKGEARRGAASLVAAIALLALGSTWFLWRDKPEMPPVPAVAAVTTPPAPITTVTASAAPSVIPPAARAVSSAHAPVATKAVVKVDPAPSPTKHDETPGRVVATPPF